MPVVVKHLTLLVCLFVAVGLANAWEPEVFEVYCGASSVDFVNDAVAGTDAPPPGNDRGSAAYYEVNYGRQTDWTDTNPACAEDQQLNSELMPKQELLEYAAARALRYYKSFGFASPSRPNRPRLGPVVASRGPNPQPVVRLFVNPASPKLMGTVSPYGKEFYERFRVARTQSSLQAIAEQDHWVFYQLAHEIVHVIQTAQTAWNHPDDRKPDVDPEWIYEGMADAMSVELTRQEYPDLSPVYVADVSGSEYGLVQNFYGLRDYSRDLRAPKLGAEYKGSPGYRTSSFFRYLDRHHFGGPGQFEFFAKWTQKHPGHRAGKIRWLKWLADHIKADIGTVFDLVFANFLTEFAVWGKDLYPNVTRKDWQQTAFGGCRRVKLTPDNFEDWLVNDEEAYYYISGKCFTVDFSGVPAGTLAKVKIAAYADTSKSLNRLHLGVSKMSSGVNTTFHCLNYNRSHPDAVNCLTQPILGKMQPMTEIAEGKTFEYVKIWKVIDQEVRDPGLKNTYVITNAPEVPDDAIDLDARFPAHILVGVEFTDLKGNHITSQTNKSSLGMFGEQPDALPVKGSEDVIATGEFDMGKIVQSIAGITTMDVPGFGDPLRVLQFTVENSEEDANGIVETAVVDRYMVLLDTPLVYGSTGTYTGKLMSIPEERGSPMEVKVSWPEDSPVQVTVEQFDAFGLKLTAQGRYCKLLDFDPETRTCTRPSRFEGVMAKPFGWAYVPGNEIVSIDSSTQANYREVFLDRMTMSSFSIPDSEPPEEVVSPLDVSVPASTIAGPADFCDCSCDLYFASKNPDLSLGQAKLLEGIQEIMRCTGSCAKEWGACEEERKHP